jgi:hypothetical protein
MDDIKEIKERKEKLESIIVKGLKNFMVETGLVINGIDFESVYLAENGKPIKAENVQITNLSIKIMNPFD